jgi:hypothetical protein
LWCKTALPGLKWLCLCRGRLLRFSTMSSISIVTDQVAERHLNYLSRKGTWVNYRLQSRARGMAMRRSLDRAFSRF